MEQPQVAVGGDQHHVGLAVVAQVCDRRIATRPSQAHGRCHFDERAVQVVAIDARAGGRREQEIEVTIVIEVDEQRSRDGGRLKVERGRTHAAETSTPFVREEVGRARSKDKKIDVPVVVVIAERRRDGAVRESNPCLRGRLDKATIAASVQVARDEEVGRVVVVVIADRQRDGSLERPPPHDTVRQRRYPLESAAGGRVDEANRPRHPARVPFPFPPSPIPQVRVERQHRVSERRPARRRRAELLEVHLIGRRDLHRLTESGQLRR